MTSHFKSMLLWSILLSSSSGKGSVLQWQMGVKALALTWSWAPVFAGHMFVKAQVKKLKCIVHKHVHWLVGCSFQYIHVMRSHNIQLSKFGLLGQKFEFMKLIHKVLTRPCSMGSCFGLFNIIRLMKEL